MSSSLEGAFNLLCSMKKIAVTLTRPKTPTDLVINVDITPSSYSRKVDAPENTVSYGREYLIPRKFFDGAAILFPKRGDILTGTYLREETIAEVEELYNMGGTLFGFRVKTE